MADMVDDEDIAFIDTMTEAELRAALVWLSGFSPDGFAAVRDRVLRDRELVKAPPETRPDPIRE